VTAALVLTDTEEHDAVAVAGEVRDALRVRGLLHLDR